ncbi:hypothetical protein ACSBR1_038908 [Camellia fascicularis]
MTMDGQTYLTTQNQPFSLFTFDSRIDDRRIDDRRIDGDVKGLCGYSMISKDYKFYMDRESSDEQLGVPGRVFNRGFPEFTPNVKYYSIKEVDWTCRALVKGDIFHVMLKFNEVDCYELLGMATVEHHLRKGQGVVGRAFYSPNVLLCKDVTQLSIMDYPLAHYARDDKLGCCFAICLQSSSSGNDIYVLECFMPPSNKDYVELQQQIANRLPLEDETYYVKYKDEVDDFIVIACDQDWQDCISACRLLGTSMVVFIDPKSSTIDQMMASFEKTLLFE